MQGSMLVRWVKYLSNCVSRAQLLIRGFGWTHQNRIAGKTGTNTGGEPRGILITHAYIVMLVADVNKQGCVKPIKPAMPDIQK